MSAVLGQERTAPTVGSPAGLTLCTFRLGGLHLGVDVTKVQEVIRRQEATRVPLVSPVIHGLMNLRGEIVTTIDLRYRMGLGTFAADAHPMNVVIRTADGPVSLVVDEIDDVVDVREIPFEPPPPTLDDVRRELVTGVYKLDHTLLLVLDLDRVLDPTDLQSTDVQPGAPNSQITPTATTTPVATTGTQNTDHPPTSQEKHEETP